MLKSMWIAVFLFSSVTLAEGFGAFRGLPPGFKHTLGSLPTLGQPGDGAPSPFSAQDVCGLPATGRPVSSTPAVPTTPLAIPYAN